MHISLSVQKLFTGNDWIKEVVIEIENGIIKNISGDGYDAHNAMPLVIPALIDLQIYGAENKLLSEFPDADTIEKTYRYCLAGGAAYFQPTIASQSNDIIIKSIDAVRAYKANGGKGCMGLHIEGPWINVEKKGAHQAEIIHSPSYEEVKAIIEYGKDYIGMITIAPEVVDQKIIDLIQANNIVISAGHTNGSYEIATSFLNKGITVGTHLYNAMSSLQHRAPGMVGALFNHPTAMCSLVADGYHVNFDAIKIAKKMMGDRLFCITDAVTTTSTGVYQHTLVGDKYESHGVLSGSALTQLKSVKNLVEKVGIELGEAIRMCSVYPARVMNHATIKGCIEIGGKADLACLSEDLNLIKMMVG
ncbi:MAG: N-acetylglucosamine-6-phosphate deacetylase [Chitinophagia bacterium]